MLSVAKVIVVFIILIASLIVIRDEFFYQIELFGGEEDEYYEEVSFTNPSCNVAGVGLYGSLYTYSSEFDAEDDIVSSDSVIYSLEMAQDSENIEAIVLEIDSYGGLPVAAEEITSTLQKYVEKPVVALIRGAGASSAYWVASGADVIFASPLSDVGSIGVTMSYVDESQQDGFNFVEINSGKFKDSGNPSKEITDEERALFQRDVDKIHEKFVEVIADNRGLDVQMVSEFADGSSVLGDTAKELGFVDELGGIYEVLDYIKANYNLEPSICW